MEKIFLLGSIVYLTLNWALILRKQGHLRIFSGLARRQSRPFYPRKRIDRTASAPAAALARAAISRAANRISVRTA